MSELSYTDDGLVGRQKVRITEYTPEQRARLWWTYRGGKERALTVMGVAALGVTALTSALITGSDDNRNADPIHPPGELQFQHAELTVPNNTRIHQEPSRSYNEFDPNATISLDGAGSIEFSLRRGDWFLHTGEHGGEYIGIPTAVIAEQFPDLANIRVIEKDPDGVVWLGSEDGVDNLHDDKGTTLTIIEE